MSGSMAAGVTATARSTVRGTWSTRGCARRATRARRGASSAKRDRSEGLPEQATTDGHAAYPRAIRETLGSGVTHRCSRYKGRAWE